MASMEMKKSTHVYPMKGGDGASSYTNNSSYQKSLSDVAMSLISDAIAKNLDITTFRDTNPICIADFGCSIGPNTFSTVQNIINSIKLKHQTLKHTSKTPDFHVFFNDHASNDFNTLFKTLPIDKPYYSAGVPGSFYGRLFPPATLHVVHSSFALHWLSELPEKGSPAWNKGRVHYSGCDEGVIRVYREQYVKDMERFLKARGEEVVAGGLVVVLVPGRPNGVAHCECIGNVLFEVLGSCMVDMANEGKIDEHIVDSMNIPIYYASPQELEEAIVKNGCFTIEKMEGLPHIPEPETKHAAGRLAIGIRVGVEGVLKGHLDDETIEELFVSYQKRLEEVPSLYSTGGASIIFSVLRRNN